MNERLLGVSDLVGVSTTGHGEAEEMISGDKDSTTGMSTTGSATGELIHSGGLAAMSRRICSQIDGGVTGVTRELARSSYATTRFRMVARKNLRRGARAGLLVIT